MGKSKVYFLSYQETKNLQSPDARLQSYFRQVFKETKFLTQIPYRRKVGIKLHFGEEGRENYLKPEYCREVVLILAESGIQPFLIETSTLYRGARQEAKTHFDLSQRHGFLLNKVLAPIQFLDGKRGEFYYEDEGKKIAGGLRKIQFLVNLSHFKGHFVCGFGGALKNIAMGLAAKGGKLDMHSLSIPYIDETKCGNCGICVDYCPHGSIVLHKGKYLISAACTGCAGCLTVCPLAAIKIDWGVSSQELLQKMAEYAQVILKNRYALHFNFLINITPNCDCFPQTEKPIMPDVGILASLDPVALDQASYDMTKNELKALYPHLKPERILERASQLGIGQREYELVTI